LLKHGTSVIEESSYDRGLRERLASKTINSRLNQNGEFEMDKG